MGGWLHFADQTRYRKSENGPWEKFQEEITLNSEGTQKT